MTAHTAKLIVLVVLLVASLAVADVYMQHPRGSNNRNCEDRNGNTGNGNRLFRSENNAQGGYNCPRAEGGANVVTPRMYYYTGSILRIDWTMQHSCQLPNVNCQVVLQYMCEDTAPGLRDGIPDPASANGQERQGIAQINLANKDNPTYGQHETAEYFTKCNTRDRNKYLFAADRNINGNNAQFTRQNEGGTTYGFECQEERDYYPYWHPTQWRDAVIWTTNTSMCEWYKKESQNVINRGECFVKGTNTPSRHNNYQDCLSNNGEWKVHGAHNTNPPECRDAEEIATRDNHLGNTRKGDLAFYDWVVPETVAQSCVLRLRYNITTMDYHPFLTDSTSNGKNSPIYTTQNANQNLYADFGYGFPLAIKMNTNQVFRTFQDRSYVFEIRKRPEQYGNAKIYNLNLRGKRGNLANIYPNMEYDFVPNNLVVNGGDYLHIQWTGSDYNPNQNSNNAEGGPLHSSGDRTCDRTNLVQIDPVTSKPRRAEHVTMFKDEKGNPDVALIRKLALIDQPIDNPQYCLNFTQLYALYQSRNQDPNNIQYDAMNCAKLGGAKTPYFDAGPVMMRASGTFTFLSTRNNNFSNRSQRGVIVVNNGWFAAASTATISVTMLLSVMAAVLLLLL